MLERSFDGARPKSDQLFTRKPALNSAKSLTAINETQSTSRLAMCTSHTQLGSTSENQIVRMTSLTSLYVTGLYVAKLDDPRLTSECIVLESINREK
jgi:hypothetical protein